MSVAGYLLAMPLFSVNEMNEEKELCLYLVLKCLDVLVLWRVR